MSIEGDEGLELPLLARKSFLKSLIRNGVVDLAVLNTDEPPLSCICFPRVFLLCPSCPCIQQADASEHSLRLSISPILVASDFGRVSEFLPWDLEIVFRSGDGIWALISAVAQVPYFIPLFPCTLNSSNPTDGATARLKVSTVGRSGDFAFVLLWVLVITELRRRSNGLRSGIQGRRSSPHFPRG